MHERPPKTALERLHLLAGVGLAAAALVAVLVVISTSGGNGDALRPGRPVPGARAAHALLDGVPQRAITLGDPHAPITLVEFADLQCPFCRAYAQNTLPGLVRELVRPGRVQMVFRDVASLGPDSVRAAAAAAGAGRVGRLWQFAAIFYANQGIENSGYVTGSFLGQVSRAAGAPLTFADPDLQTTRMLARRYGLQSTPSFLLGRTGGTLHEVSEGDIRSGVAALR
ncbi:MAG: DsbA family protein [Solirubrobacteraceae bacterium]